MRRGATVREREKRGEVSHLFLMRGSSSLVARQIHYLKVVSSNPTPATIYRARMYR